MELNRKTSVREYDVDADRVAREILEKARIIRRVREQLEADEAGRIRPDPVRRARYRGRRFTRQPEHDSSRTADHQPAVLV